MSFSQDIKLEISKIYPEKKCCQLAEIAGFIRFAGSISLQPGGRMGIKLVTDNPSVARAFITMVKNYFGAKTALSLGEPIAVGKGKSYVLDITPEMNAEQILREVGMLGVKEGHNYITEGLSADVIKKRCCKKAALRGIFMAAGSISDPRRSYHMEINCLRQELAKDVARTVNSFGLKAKISKRRERYIVYIKDGEQILDFIGTLGANNAYFEYQDVRLTKEMRNQTNRAQNCVNANLDKMVNAAARQMAAINKIEETKGLGVLNEKLYEAAVMRRENPELSLEELAALFDPPLKKSGLNHRLSKIVEFAERIGDNG